ncbi:MAG: SHOCT domain-containing protein [bacterium]|nr:SHOCT domain-containing protein [bacterium]
MGRFLVILGVFGIIAGTIGIAYSMFSPIQNMVSSVMDVESEGGRAEVLCNDGETLRTVEGTSTRNSSGTYGRPVSYYCVDTLGNEREVTGEFVTDLMGDATSTTTSLITNSFLWTGVILVGVFFTIIGAIMGAKKGARGYTIRVNGQPIVMGGQGINVANPMPMGVSPQDTSVRLQKLEQLYQSNLISREEYDRARQKILDDIR